MKLLRSPFAETIRIPSLTLAALAVGATLQANTPLGSEFRVNSYTPSHQSYPAVATDSRGNFMVVWHSAGQEGPSNRGIFARRYDASGTAQGGDIHVNQYTTFDQRSPGIAVDGNDNFILVWQSANQDRWKNGVFARRYDAIGNPLGPEFQVNQSTVDDQDDPAVAADSDGNFVVVWRSYIQDGSFSGIFGRRFSPSGSPLGAEFRVNSYTPGQQLDPAVAMDPNGNFLVAWISPTHGCTGTCSYDVYARRFSASGSAQGSDFRVNVWGTGPQTQPSVAVDASGTYTVAWTSRDQDGSGSGVYARRYSASGAALGSEFRVNSQTASSQARPSVSAHPGGEFVVSFSSCCDGSLYKVSSRRFDSSGQALGPDFQVNTYTSGSQDFGRVATGPGGRFNVVWNSVGGQDGSGEGIFARRYGSGGLFDDNFEAGNVNKWAASVNLGTAPVVTSAAMAGTQLGLQAVASGATSRYVEDRTPNNESRYRARFYFDPNGFDPGEALGNRTAVIFGAYEEGPLRRVAAVILKRVSGQFSVAGEIRRDDGRLLKTSFVPLSNGPHSIEIDWKRATAAGAANGSLELWLDGVSVARRTGVDNDQKNVDLARLGAVSLSSGATGALYWDQFVSRRDSYIGE